MGIDALLEHAQYALPQAEKEELLTARLRDLTAAHRERSPAYRRILDRLGPDPAAIATLHDVPMLPIGLFKSHELRSIPEPDVFKVVTSSGTTGAAVSRVFLDAPAAQMQTRVLAGIMSDWLGPARLPMIVVDARSTLRDRHTFSARAAGIIGMVTFGRDHFFALDADMRLDREGLQAWLGRHAGTPVLVFGFTFMVWQHLLGALAPGELDLGEAILVHSGGWKKLADQAVDNATFRAELERVTGLRRVHNFYGMAEQIGTAFVECAHGVLHAPNLADVVIREPGTWRALGPGETGMIQLLSALPESYPGHSILTEDLGRIEVVDDCPCGRRGKGITVLGRVPGVELRGCSDTHAHDVLAAA